jgi:methyl-accepting chemotaxis protein
MIRSTTLGVLSLAIGLAAPAFGEPAQAEYQPPLDVAARQTPDRLDDQERRMLKLAQDFARRSEQAMEGWIADGETTEAKLFSFLYYPVEGTDPPKFRTDWDELADRDIRPIEDDILSKSASLIFTVLVDRHGYLPAHNTRYSQPLTGNPAVDLVNNRTKRIFADKTGLAAARNTQPYLIQRYQRDTGEKMADLSVPIHIQGKKWGSVRLGYRAAEGL